MSDTAAAPAAESTENSAPTRPRSAWAHLERIGDAVDAAAAEGAAAESATTASGGEPAPSSLPVIGLVGGGLPIGGGDPVGAADGGTVPSAGRGFSIVLVGLVDDDHEWVRSRERLSADIYTRQVALRYAAAKAKADAERGYLAVIDPMGRCIGVFTTGTGRQTGPETTKRVRRVLQRNGQTKKRTSRPSKRTSR